MEKVLFVKNASNRNSRLLKCIFVFYLISLSFNFTNSQPQIFKEEEDHPCEQKTDILVKSLLTQTPLPPEQSDFYYLMLNSGSGINDLGDYIGCHRLNFTKYFIITYEDQFKASVGLCYFKECDEAYLKKSKDNILVLLKQYKGIEIKSESISFYEPAKGNEEMRTKYISGFNVVIAFLCFILLLNLAQCYYKYKPCEKSVPILFNITEERDFSKSFLDRGNNSNATREKKVDCLEFFDFFKNSSKIFTINNINKTTEHLRVFDGIRFFSTCWIVFSHVFISNSSFTNPADPPEFFKTLKFAFVISGLYAVDIFFYMSGFLLCFGLQKYLTTKVKKVKTFFFVIINRYLRFLPLYLFILIAFPYVIPFLGDGPHFTFVEGFNKGCWKNFWKNLLYINNLIPQSEELCATHCWYLANDMQFYIFGLLIYLLFNTGKLKWIRHITFGLIYNASLVYQFFEVYDNNYALLDFVRPTVKIQDFFDKFYIKPWTRFCTFILGLYFCELFLASPLYKKDNPGDNTGKDYKFYIKINSFLINNNWASNLLFIFSLISIIYAVLINAVPNNYELSIFWHAVFLTFNKIFFVFGLASIVHLIFLGKFNSIFKILSGNLFTCLSRVTFGVYIFHMSLLQIFFSSLPALMYFNFSDFVIWAVGLIFVIFCVSFVFTVLLESPVVNAIKMCLEDGRKSKTEGNTNGNKDIDVDSNRDKDSARSQNKNYDNESIKSKDTNEENLDNELNDVKAFKKVKEGMGIN